MGWIKDMRFTDYLALDAIDASLIKSALRGREFIKLTHKESDALNFGRAFHIALLEPEKFAKLVQVRDGGVKTKKHAAQKEKDLQTYGDDALDFIYISEDERNTIDKMREAIYQFDDVKKLLLPTEKEITGILDFPNGKAPGKFKIRVDAKGRNYLLDLKTTTASGFDYFTREIVNYGYDIQAAFYLWVANVIEGSETYERWFWLVVEKSAPFRVALYEAPESVKVVGLKKAFEGVHKIRDAYRENKFSELINTEITMPAWYEAEMEKVLETNGG